MKKELLLLFLFLPLFSYGQEEILLDSTTLHYSVAVDSTHLQGAWDIDWGFDDRLWITDNKHIKTWDPVTDEINTLFTSSYGNFLGLAVPEIALEDEIYFYAVLDTHDLHYHSGVLAEVYRFTYDVIAESVINDSIIFEYMHYGEHSGGRLAIANDQTIFLTTADYFPEADSLFSTFGKVLRFNSDGSVPEDNCRPDYTYTYGHRNAQGLVILPSGEIFISEHGQLYGSEEINHIIKCKNYGWPSFDGYNCIAFSDSCDSPTFLATYKGPILSGYEYIKPPAGMDYYNHPAIPELEHCLITGLLFDGNEISVARLNEANDTIVFATRYTTPFNRTRDICVAPDGSFYAIGNDRRPNILGDDVLIYRVWNPEYVPPIVSTTETTPNKQIHLFPNPTTAVINISTNVPIRSCEITVTDLSGKILFTQKSVEHGIDLSQLPNGMYIISGSINGISFSEKVRKQE